MRARAALSRRQLTASRLASLNHGSIVSPLPGSEVGIVLAKVKDWARQVPEIHVDPESRNPVIRVQLSDVDYDSVVERAKGEDNDGRRRELLKDLVREAVSLTARDADVFGAYAHTVIWRGSRRAVGVVFGNVRDASWLTDDHFRACPGTWRVVIDHPFDEAGHSAAEDLARLDRLVEAEVASRTIVWLPRFLAEERMRDVRRLVVLVRWWTWAGARANAAVAAALTSVSPGLVDDADRYDNRYLRLRSDAAAGEVRTALRDARDQFGDDLGGVVAPVSDEALKQLKFAELLPPALAAATLAARAADQEGCRAVVRSPVIGGVAGT